MIEKRETEHGSEVWAGQHRLALFTLETEQAAIERFVKLCAARDAELVELGQEYEQAVQWNGIAQSEGRAGKNWPVFTRRERVMNKLCAEAGIVDT